MVNKATIYDLGGNVLREVEVKKVEPWPCHYCRITMLDDKYILTNMPVAATGVDCFGSVRAPTPEEVKMSQTFDVTMVLGEPGGRLVRKWERASWFLQSEGMAWFWHGDRMVCVAGPILVENFSTDEGKTP